MVISRRFGLSHLFILVLMVCWFIWPVAFSGAQASNSSSSVFGLVQENQTLTLEAPSGHVFTSVNFLSYGLPSGSDGNYMIDQGCHSTLSESQIEQLIIGLQSVSIPASNNLFGDPCSGVPKRLAVVLSYAPSTPPTLPGLQYWTFQSSGSMPIEPITNDSAITNGVVPSISYNWGGGVVGDSGRSDGVIVKYEGFIQPVDPGTYSFYLCSDDGMRLYLNGSLIIDNWWDRGPSCGSPQDVDFTDGQAKSLTVFYYENGGGAMVALRYLTPQNFVADVPSAWFSYGQSPSSTTTTTTTTTTTQPKFLGQPQNVNVIQGDESVQITWEAADDNIGVQPERYAISWSDGQSGWGVATGNVGDETALNTFITLDKSIFSSTGGLDVSYVFKVRADNDTYSVYSQESASVTFLVSSPVPPTTTTQAPQTTTTVPAPIIIPEPPIIDESDNGGSNDSDGSPVDESEPAQPGDGEPADPETPETEVPESTPNGENEETTEDTLIENPTDEEQPIDTSVPPPTDDSENTEEPSEPEDPINEDALTEDISADEAEAIIDELIADGVDSGEAAAIASSPIALQVLAAEEASEVFEALELSELSQEEAAAVVEAVQNAPDEVRASFEEEIDIFASGGAVDNYVPLGSTVTVAQRRALIAVSAVFATLAAAPVASASSNSKRGK